MWHDSRDHAVELKDGSDFDEERREVGGGGRGGCSWAGTNAGDFDDVGPGDEKGGVVLPL